MNARADNKIRNREKMEMGEFHRRFRPYVNRIYRGALILTGSPGSAKKLQTEVYLRAFMAYLQAEPIANFKAWLIDIVSDCFFTFGDQQISQTSTTDSPYERAMEVIEATCYC
ncbi:hypothetical protein GWO43_23390 [candidate division KSB1 bacterium]|nr:hypothetical protein [candidate division KSB1 bacterium]NIR73051.1 hypothetical protein [candidate division KSB1 bacterium]NIS26921.1 hypothetical protein [candidate division KSB1 bacterium]NIT73762.1 hypothetical protein [candidate division KSB1 bacterium]NIU27666.1 hypothetical protein [candidate division KSB1 bacterium]